MATTSVLYPTTTNAITTGTGLTWTNPTAATGAPNSAGGTAVTGGATPNNSSYWTNAARSTVSTIEFAGWNLQEKVHPGAASYVVSAAIYHAEFTATTVASVTAQLYSGATAIGTAQTVVRSNAYANAAISFPTNPTYAQLADLRIRYTVTRPNSTTSTTSYVDAVGIQVTYTPPSVNSAATGFELPQGTVIPIVGNNGGDWFSDGTQQAGNTFIADGSFPAAIATGSSAAKISVDATGAGASHRSWWLNSSPRGYFRVYMYLTSYSSALFAFAYSSDASTGSAIPMYLWSDGRLSVSGKYTTSVPLNTLIRVEGTYDYEFSSATLRWFLGHETTATSTATSAVTYGSGTITGIKLGAITSPSANFSFYTDDWAVSNIAALGPSGTIAVPTKASTLIYSRAAGSWSATKRRVNGAWV